ncbi:hypothetical protein TNCV_3839731 [Trichonephila clavipes]|nr:hypothetical protein TNCV_3839731 [Trichonephila clavipes]
MSSQRLVFERKALRGPSPKSPHVAEQCDVNIQSINQSIERKAGEPPQKFTKAPIIEPTVNPSHRNFQQYSVAVRRTRSRGG